MGAPMAFARACAASRASDQVQNCAERGAGGLGCGGGRRRTAAPAAATAAAATAAVAATAAAAAGCTSIRVAGRVVLVCCAGKDLQESHLHPRSHSHDSSSNFKGDEVHLGSWWTLSACCS